MIVCIAEKPSVARDIAEVLGAHNKKDGFIEGNGYQQDNRIVDAEGGYDYKLR